jgi:uncharacterized membrane protein
MRPIVLLALPTPPPALSLAASTLSAYALKDSAVGRAISPPMLAFSAAMALSNGGAMPMSHPLFDRCSTVGLPLAVALGLLSAGGDAAAETGEPSATVLRPVLIAFALGALGTILGSMVAFAVSRLGRDAAATAAGLMCATYIGGSANFFGVAAATRAAELHPGLIPALLAADLALMGVYLLVLTAAARAPWLQRLFPARHNIVEGGVDAKPLSSSEIASRHEIASLPPLRVAGFVAAIGALAMASCRVAVAFEAAVHTPGSGFIALSAACTVAGGTLRRRAPALASAIAAPLADASLVLFCAFLATVGASARLAELLVAGPAAAAFAATVLAVHSACMLLGVWLCNRVAGTRISLAQLIIASNANVGGVGTAIAMASAMGWRALVGPGAVVGAIGYAIATALGVTLRSALL